MPHASRRALDARLMALGLTSPDPAAIAKFYAERMGMSLATRGDAVLASGRDRLIVFSPGKAKSLAFAGYAVAGVSELDSLRQRLTRDGVEPCAFDDVFGLFNGEHIAVRDPDGNLIVFGMASANARSTPEGVTPDARLQHCVVASRDAALMSEFYQKTLGFKLSDNVQDEEGGLRAAFLRTDHEHHSFAVFRAPTDRFDHHCYEVRDWNAIRDWGDHFSKFETVMAWGPGRHGPGNNLFFFVHDPDGNWLEFSAELEVVDDERVPGVWPHAQRTLNYWGSAPLRS
jgi:catechol 2,3-dioxygenase